jgi:hypothetical protein
MACPKAPRKMSTRISARCVSDDQEWLRPICRLVGMDTRAGCVSKISGPVVDTVRLASMFRDLDEPG